MNRIRMHFRIFINYLFLLTQLIEFEFQIISIAYINAVLREKDKKNDDY